jgi:hypothetical protein
VSGWLRTRTVTCSCGRIFTRLTRDRYLVCLRCFTWARMAMAGITADDPALLRIATHNAEVRRRVSDERDAA